MNEVPSSMTAVLTLARLTFVRLQRGKMLWISLAIAFLPVLAATGLAQKSPKDVVPTVFGIEMLVLAVLPPLFIASSIGDEIEDRTTTYLWSRPLARWAILAGKLLALAPFAIAVVIASWVAAVELSLHVLPPASTIVGLAAGALAVSCVSTGLATVVPKHGMALSIVYVILDLLIGQIPASIHIVSVTNAALTIARIGDDGAPAPTSSAIAMAVIAGLWIMVGFRRIQELEA